jgi:DNA modification methylase
MGLRSELGRDEGLAFSVSSQPVATYQIKNAYDEKLGRKSTWQEFATAHPEAITQTGTSIFDPVLCEIAYRWFCPPGGVVLDPFAGGSVRGVVAAKLGRQYVGVDLRAEQVEANRQQWAELATPEDPAPVWHAGDSREVRKHAKGVKADLMFSCPPYADLEVYSDDPADLSRMAYPEFQQAYRQIVKESLALLKPDRFACFVVGEVRSPDGTYRNFGSDTIAAFVDAGAKYYNEAVLVTQVGSLAIRAGKGFTTSRKLGKTHQNVLVPHV